MKHVRKQIIIKQKEQMIKEKETMNKLKRVSYECKGFCRCGLDLTKQMNPFRNYFLRMVCCWCNEPKDKCKCKTVQTREALI